MYFFKLVDAEAVGITLDFSKNNFLLGFHYCDQVDLIPAVFLPVIRDDIHLTIELMEIALNNPSR